MIISVDSKKILSTSLYFVKEKISFHLDKKCAGAILLFVAKIIETIVLEGGAIMKKKHILMVIALAAINFLLFPAAARAGFLMTADGIWILPCGKNGLFGTQKTGQPW